MCKSIDFFFLFHRNCKEGEGFIQNPKGGHRPPLPLLPLLVNGLGGWKISRAQVFFPQIHQNFISPNWRENRWERNSYSQCLNYHLLLLCARHAIGFFFFFANILLGVIRYNFFRFCGCFLLFCSSSLLFIYLFFGLTGHDFFFYIFFWGMIFIFYFFIYNKFGGLSFFLVGCLPLFFFLIGNHYFNEGI